MGGQATTSLFRAGAVAPWEAFQARGYVFSGHTTALKVWDFVIAIAVMYSVFMLPLTLVFHQSRYGGQSGVDALVDVLLMFDVVINFRRSYLDHGYETTSWKHISLRYLSTWALLDVLAALPLHDIRTCTRIGKGAGSAANRNRVAEFTADPSSRPLSTCLLADRRIKIVFTVARPRCSPSGMRLDAHVHACCALAGVAMVYHRHPTARGEGRIGRGAAVVLDRRGSIRA